MKTIENPYIIESVQQKRVIQMDKDRISYDLAMRYAECKLNEVFMGVPCEEYRFTDKKQLLYLFFEEAYVYYLNMSDESFDFSDVLHNEQ